MTLQLLQAFFVSLYLHSCFFSPWVNERLIGSRSRAEGGQQESWLTAAWGLWWHRGGTESSGALLNISSIWCHYRPCDHHSHHQLRPGDCTLQAWEADRELRKTHWRHWINLTHSDPPSIPMDRTILGCLDLQDPNIMQYVFILYWPNIHWNSTKTIYMMF